MGALTGNAIKDTYLDVVQLGKSGAGLPSHAGKEAALYDGSGAQILGRTAVRHWLDPHPDAASFDETWEFSATGDMTQAQLEAAGWTFASCTAAVSNGTLWITTGAAANPWARAYLSTSLSGDFDIVTEVCLCNPGEIEAVISGIYGGVGVFDSVGDKGHISSLKWVTDRFYSNVWYNGKWSDGGGHTNASGNATFTNPNLVRISRYSGTVYMSIGSSWPTASLSSIALPIAWRSSGSVANADTYNILSMMNYAAVAGGPSSAVWGVRSIRRFA
jgi:hypothetical protein